MYYKKVNLSTIPNDKKIILRVELLPDIFARACATLKPMFGDNVSTEEVKESINAFLDFDISSYANLCNGPQSLWDEHVGFTDKVFGKFNDDDKIVFTCLLIHVHQQIKSVMSQLEDEEDPSLALSSLCKSVAEDIRNASQVINLFGKITEIADTIPIPTNPNLGTREQDTEDMTFYPIHIKAVFAITITAKIFLPVFATMLAESKTTTQAKKGKDQVRFKSKTKIIDNKTKEIFCLAFVEKLFEDNIPDHYEKFLRWIAKFTERNKKAPSNIQCSSTFRNITLVELIKMVSASIICKRCVNIGLYSQSSNIMGVIQGAIRTTVESIEKDTQNNAYFIRQLQAGGDDASTNESQLEANSMKSKETFQVDLQIKRIYYEAVDKYLRMYNIPAGFLEQVTRYNILQNPPLEDFLLPLLNSVFYGDFESGQSIPFLDYEPFINLVSLTQIICARKGMYGLAHRLTAQRVKDANGDYELKIKNTNDHALAANALADAKNVIDKMRLCKTRFSSQEKGKTLTKEVRNWVKEFSNFLTTYQCYYNTEPDLARFMGAQDPFYRGPFVLETDLFRHYCILLEGKVHDTQGY